MQFAFRLLLLAAAVVLVSTSASRSLAGQAPATLSTLESLKLSLDQLELTANRDNLPVPALLDLQRALAPLADEVRERRAAVEPELARLDRRIKELGPPPAKDAPAELPAVAAERDQLARQFSDLDAAAKLAKLLEVRLEQLSERLDERRSAIFARRLFDRTSSMLDPFLWIEAARVVPDQLRGTALLLQGWWGYVEDRGPERLIAALGTFMLIAGLAAILVARLRRRLGVAKHETRFAKARAGLTIASVAMLSLPLVIAAALATARAYDLLPDRIGAIGVGLLIGAAVAGLGHGLAEGVLAPGRPQRRLPAIDDASARQLAWHLAWAARALGATIFLNVLYREVVTPAALTLATNALFAAVVFGLLAHLLMTMREEADGTPGPPHPAAARWVRGAAWLVAATIALALALGYIGAATFIAERLIATVAVFAVLYLLLVLTDAIFAEVLTGSSPRARTVAATLGLTPRGADLAGTVLSALLRLVLILVAVVLPFLSRGSFATEVFGAATPSALVLSLGRLGISIAAVLRAAAVLAIGLLGTRAVQRWLDLNFLPRTALEPGLQHSISTILGYVGVIAAVTLALAEFGIDLQKIALVAGALSVGIGFGLQSIVSNFVSGLILLAERPIRVGDMIVVKGEEGYVRRISVRATEIETFERASVIVPNSELISGVVKNWTHGDANGRIIVKVGASYDADPDVVRGILAACAGAHPEVLRVPAPRAFLVGFGESALEFELRCFVANIDHGLIVRSDLHLAILQRLREAGIAIAYPQREVRLLREHRGAAGETKSVADAPEAERLREPVPTS